MSTTAQEWQSVLDQATAQQQAAKSAAQQAWAESWKADIAATEAAKAQAAAVASGNSFGPAYAAYNEASAAATAAKNASTIALANLKSIDDTIAQANKSLAAADSTSPLVPNPVPQPAGAVNNADATGDNTAVSSSVTPELIAASKTTGQYNEADPTVAARLAAISANRETVQNEAPQTVVSGSAVTPELVAAAKATGQYYEADPAIAARLAAIDANRAQAPQEQKDPDESEYAAETNRLKAQEAAAAEAAENDAEISRLSARGLSAQENRARAQGSAQDVVNYNQQGDWRVRLRLGPGADYLYKSDDPGILGPLNDSDGVIFPYTPTITVGYAASYDTQDLTHSNYKIHQYKSSSVDNISITCDFTAQDTFEANYLLAVIHFFRSATKMFYGQDQQPKPGTPPPLCFLTGMGSFQFEQHPLAITGFTYTLPNNVDYIRAGATPNNPGTNLAQYNTKSTAANVKSLLRLGGIQPGGIPAAPKFQKLANKEPTYVPTKIQLQIQCIPIISRNNISNNFSLKQYSSGKLLRGSNNPGGGGFW